MFGYYLELALKGLARNKILTTLMVLSIAMGIGTSMTTLTIMHALAGDPLPSRSAYLYYPQLDPFPTVAADHTEPPDVMDYRSAVDLWEAGRADRQALIASSPIKVRAPDTKVPAAMLSMLSTTSDFFPMFKVSFKFGGAWTPEEDRSRARVVVISSSLNELLFGGANSVGRIIRARDADLRIVGVLEPWRPVPLFYEVMGGGFLRGNTADFYGRPEDILAPFSTGLDINAPAFSPFMCWQPHDEAVSMMKSSCVWVGLWVELGDSAKVRSYREFLDGYAKQQVALGRFVAGKSTRLRSLMEWLDYNGVVPSDVRLQTWVAFSFLGMCLLNAAGLLLASFLRRGYEIGTRRALGATTGDVFFQHMVEAGLLGVLGGIAGMMLTLLGLYLMRLQPTPYADLIRLDLGMSLTIIALSMVSALLAGVLPAIRACRVAPSLQLKAL
ncbi:ABC transporter permease [Dyella subtropica]|uniref:ABC transporter permease n=1 Tax=Dyella subtropica TaxID=2992127 RepID=UPI0022590147|nr:ABC transporter permease [Dyella subtropica]